MWLFSLQNPEMPWKFLWQDVFPSLNSAVLEFLAHIQEFRLSSQLCFWTAASFWTRPFLLYFIFWFMEWWAWPHLGGILEFLDENCYWRNRRFSSSWWDPLLCAVWWMHVFYVTARNDINELLWHAAMMLQWVSEMSRCWVALPGCNMLECIRRCIFALWMTVTNWGTAKLLSCSQASFTLHPFHEW